MILPKYAALYEQNNDLFSWLRIDDTPINYPVMHMPEDPQYYLSRAFDKRDAQSGTPFLDGACFEGYGNYDTGLSAEYGDGLITLSTCSYHTTDGRFVVVAKKKFL